MHIKINDCFSPRGVGRLLFSALARHFFLDLRPFGRRFLDRTASVDDQFVVRVVGLGRASLGGLGSGGLRVRHGVSHVHSEKNSKCQRLITFLQSTTAIVEYLSGFDCLRRFLDDDWSSADDEDAAGVDEEALEVAGEAAVSVGMTGAHVGAEDGDGDGDADGVRTSSSTKY